MKLLTSSSSRLSSTSLLQSSGGRWRNTATGVSRSPRLDLRCVSARVCMREEANKRAEGSSVPLLLFLVSLETQARSATELMLNNELGVYKYVCVWRVMEKIEMSEGLYLWYGSENRPTSGGTHWKRDEKQIDNTEALKQKWFDKDTEENINLTVFIHMREIESMFPTRMHLNAFTLSSSLNPADVNINTVLHRNSSLIKRERVFGGGGGDRCEVEVWEHRKCENKEHNYIQEKYLNGEKMEWHKWNSINGNGTSRILLSFLTTFNATLVPPLHLVLGFHSNVLC